MSRAEVRTDTVPEGHIQHWRLYIGGDFIADCYGNLAKAAVLQEIATRWNAVEYGLAAKEWADSEDADLWESTVGDGLD